MEQLITLVRAFLSEFRVSREINNNKYQDAGARELEHPSVSHTQASKGQGLLTPLLVSPSHLVDF